METEEYFVIVSTDNEEEFKDERRLFDIARREAMSDIPLNLKYKKGEPRRAFTTQSGGKYHYWLWFPITSRKGLMAWTGLALDKYLQWRGRMTQIHEEDLAETFGHVLPELANGNNDTWPVVFTRELQDK